MFIITDKLQHNNNNYIALSSVNIGQYHHHCLSGSFDSDPDPTVNVCSDPNSNLTLPSYYLEENGHGLTLMLRVVGQRMSMT